MKQYIDKAALVAEIEKKIRTEQGYSSGDAECGYRDCTRDILSFIDTLEVKEVDLDMEVALWANAIPEIRLDDIERLAKYFFELGLKAQKGE